MPLTRTAALAAAMLIACLTIPALAAPPGAVPTGSDGRWVASTPDLVRTAPSRGSAGLLIGARAKAFHPARPSRAASQRGAQADVSRETMGGLAPAGGSRKHYRGANARLVATINAQLRRWLRPTGRCVGGTEWLATQYGAESGKRTASGSPFRPAERTAAHNTLPFGTSLAVWNPATRSSVTVKVTDRGPATIADIDLSTGAAKAIGMRSSAYVCVSRM